MNEKRHMKAQDVFEETDYVFRKKVRFTDAFPDIESLTVKVHETGPDNFDDVRFFDENTVGEFINCGRSNCYKGGVNIGEKLREMYRDKKTELQFEDVCHGTPGSPKGRRASGRPCAHFFDVKITAVYR